MTDKTKRTVPRHPTAREIEEAALGLTPNVGIPGLGKQYPANTITLLPMPDGHIYWLEDGDEGLVL